MNNLVKMTRSEYTTAKNNLTLVCPNVALISDEAKVVFLKSNPETGVGIKAVDGKCYTSEEWSALETKPTAVGVYVKHSSGGFVIHGTLNGSQLRWGEPLIEVAGCASIGSAASAILDMGGWDNTEAVLAAKTAGDLTSCPIFDWARGLTFADSSQGYIPSIGELKLIADNLSEINACRTLLSQTTIAFSDYIGYWSSTQMGYGDVWIYTVEGVRRYDATGKQQYRYSIAVCAL